MSNGFYRRAPILLALLLLSGCQTIDEEQLAEVDSLYQQVFKLEDSSRNLNLAEVIAFQTVLAGGADIEGDIPYWLIPQKDLLAALARLKASPAEAAKIRQSLAAKHGLVSSLVRLKRGPVVESNISPTDPMARSWEEWEATFGRKPLKTSRLLEMMMAE